MKGKLAEAATDPEVTSLVRTTGKLLKEVLLSEVLEVPGVMLVLLKVKALAVATITAKRARRARIFIVV